MINSLNNQRLQFLSIGHFTHDIVGDDLILGGASAYSSATARKMGLNTGVVTSVGKDFIHYNKLNGISLYIKNNAHENSKTTTFQNIYENGVRRQIIRSVAEMIGARDIPDDCCDAEIVYICPVANEVGFDVIKRFPNSIIGASPQGWMRRWRSDGGVYAEKWQNASKIIPDIDVLVMSEEDIAPFPNVIDEYVELSKITILTRGERGSTLFFENKVIDFPAFKVKVIDPTGAGDVFATAFLIKYKETIDPYEASVFANCVASFVVEKKGTEGIPNIEDIKERLASRF
jgi:sugar/nucleoside kinase (ribokinase family)